MHPWNHQMQAPYLITTPYQLSSTKAIIDAPPNSLRHPSVGPRVKQ